MKRKMKDKKSSLNGTFTCTICQFSSVFRKKLQEHEAIVHKKVINNFDCCGVHFTNRANLLQHMGECHNIRYKCNICGRGFYLLASIRRHEAIHSGNRKYKCSFCDYTSFQRCNLDRHLKRHNNEDDDFSQPDTHSFEMSKGKVLICKLCSFKTKGKSVLTKHMVTMHKKVTSGGSHFSSKAVTRQNIEICDSHKNKNDRCERVFGSQQFPRRHKTEAIKPKTRPVQVSVTNNLLTCSLCPFSTKYSFNLKQHTTRMHEPSAKLLMCCDIQFDTKFAFRNHKACHAKGYECTVCGVSFLSEILLRQHRDVHSDKSPCENTIPSTDEPTQHALEENVSDSDDAFPKVKAAKAHSILRSRSSRYVPNREKIAFCTSNKEQGNPKRNFRDEEKSKISSGEVTYETTLLQHKPIRHQKGPCELLQTTLHKLKKHELGHPDFKEYTCDLCDHTSSWQNHIKHMMEHFFRNNRPLPPTLQNDKLVIDSVPTSLNDSYRKPLLPLFTGVMFNSIMHDEARILRTQILITMSVSKLLPLLGRLLEICSSIMNLIRGAMDIEVRFRAIECFEFVWNVSKIAIVRWEDLQGPADRNTSFNAVQYAYTMLPVFLDLEKDEHLEMTEHIILLIIDIVKDCQLPSLIRSELSAKIDPNSLPTQTEYLKNSLIYH